MIINKVITISKDISLEDLYLLNSNTRDEALLKDLKETYEGHCLFNTFILSIDRLIASTRIQIHTDVHDGTGSTDCTFEAKCLVLPENDIIVNCKVIKKVSDGRMLCHATMHETAQIKIACENSEDNKAIIVDDIVPIRILKSSYATGKKNIVVIGKVLRPSIPQRPIFRVLSELKETTHIKSAVPKEDKLFLQYEALLYPYPKLQKSKFKGVEFDFTDLAKLKKIKPGTLLTVSPEMSFTRPLCLEISEELKNELVVDASMDQIMDYFMTMHEKEVALCVELAKVYGDVSKNARFDLFWKLFHSKKTEEQHTVAVQAEPKRPKIVIKKSK